MVMYTKLRSYEDHFDFRKTNQFAHTPKRKYSSERRYLCVQFVFPEQKRGDLTMIEIQRH